MKELKLITKHKNYTFSMTLHAKRTPSLAILHPNFLFFFFNVFQSFEQGKMWLWESKVCGSRQCKKSWLSVFYTKVSIIYQKCITRNGFHKVMVTTIIKLTTPKYFLCTKFWVKHLLTLFQCFVYRITSSYIRITW